MILSNAKRLKGTSFGISRDYPSEISEARKELWPEFKMAREKYGPRRVSLRFPASLVINGDTVKDLFPDWHEVLKGSRNSDVRNRIDEQVKVLATEVVKASSSFKPTLDFDSDDTDDDSEMETSIPNHQQNATNISTANIQLSTSEKNKRQAPAIPSTPPVNTHPCSPPLNLSKPSAATSTTDSGGSPHTGYPALSHVTNV